MFRVQALAVTALALCAAAPAATTPLVITQADSGKSFALRHGRIARLRLSNRWTWTAPHLTGSSIALAPVSYRTNPGYREWEIRTVARGRATIRSTGTPGCQGCTPTQRRFRVVVVVVS